MDIKAVRAEARRQIDAEDFATAVKAEKEYLRRKRWWHVLFPFRINITITRRA